MNNEKKEHVLQCADRLFHKYGYQMTTVSIIAAKAHISKGAIYQYFDNKEQIAYCLVSQKIDSLINQLAQEVNFKESNSKILLSLYEYTYRSIGSNDWIFETSDDIIQSITLKTYTHRLYKYLERVMFTENLKFMSCLSFYSIKLKMVCGSFYRLFRQNIYMSNKQEQLRMLCIYFNMIQNHMLDHCNGGIHE
jgi:AcrR family transcriptional regulator